MRKTLLACLCATGLAACATPPEEIPAAYVSPLQYRDLDCDQIGAELERVSFRTNELYARLKKRANDDESQMAVGMILFWPALFFLDGSDNPQAQEYARLKGEFDALERLAIRRKCDASIIPVKRPVPAPTEDDGEV